MEEKTKELSWREDMLKKLKEEEEITGWAGPYAESFQKVKIRGIKKERAGVNAADLRF